MSIAKNTPTKYVNRLKYSKPIEQIVKADRSVLMALEDWHTYSNIAADLHEDITKLFDSPVLWGAINNLIEHIEKYAEAHATYRLAGFTTDDAHEYVGYLVEMGEWWHDHIKREDPSAHG